MRLLVTRPERDARKLARRLEKAGHEVCVSPVLAMQATGADIPKGAWDALVATSAYAFEFLAPGDAKHAAALRALPLYVVGARTAEAAQRAGFFAAAACETDAGSLARAMICGLPAVARVLYLAGVDRKPVLEAAMKSGGFSLSVVEVYRAVAAPALTPAAVTKLRGGGLDAVLHFSRRSAEIFAHLIETGGLVREAQALRHICLSQDVAVGLERLDKAKAIWPDTPDVAAMLQLLDPGGS